eukprot:gene12792-14103_t
MTQTAPQMHKGIVKQVLSGDCVVLRGQPKGGPPPEQQLALSNVVAPKVGKRANPNTQSLETRDEPYAWESREYLRSKLIGKEVMFTIEYKPPGSGRVYGSIYMKSGESTELVSITESLVSEGLVEVRRGGIKPSDDQTRLIDLEDIAKDQKKGKWSDDSNEHVRNITWNIENPRNFVDQQRGKPVNAIIEMVRDGSTVRAFVLPTFEYVTVLMTGIKCPMFKMEGDKQVPEMYAQEAKFFTDSRLLQREVQIIFEGVSNQNFLGTIIHPAGNIAELMLREGFARCVDWSMGVLSSGHEKYRQAEKSAKQKQLRIWKNYSPASTAVTIKDSEFTGKVVEVVNADAVVVMLPSKEFKKIFFSSLRPPRAQPKDEDGQENGPNRDNKRGKPLYDVPYMFEAREFLRKKLIGKKVDVKIDYIKPANDGFPERTCATVTIGGINVAEALISKGLATALRHRQDDDQRSSQYDDLLAAENRASKNGKGLHSRKEPPIHRVADISGDRAKAQQFLPFLQRAGKSAGIVEFVASGSRFRLYLPKETCQITFLLAGITCPKVRSVTPQGNVISEGEPFGDLAMAYSKEHCLQREVEVQVESIDRAGNFIGWMFVDGANLSADLIENGLSKVHFTAERSSYFKDLSIKEQRAKDASLNMWKGYVEEKTETVVEETERKTNFTKVVVTEVVDGVNFWAQNVDTAERFENMMMQLRSDLTNNPPLPGSFTPKKGDMCAGLFVDDNLWYRVKVEKVDSQDKVHVLYLDYGNRDVIPSSKMATLPPTYHSFAPQAHEYHLACIMAPVDDDDKRVLANVFVQEVLNEQFLLNIEYKFNGQDFVTLSKPETKDDIALKLLSEGYAMLENRREKRLQPLVSGYRKSQETARRDRAVEGSNGNAAATATKEPLRICCQTTPACLRNGFNEFILLSNESGSLNPLNVLKYGAEEEKAESARMSSFVGAIAIGDLVKTTLGPKGMDKILISAGRSENIQITNDGATILKSAGVDNPAAKVLVDIAKVQDDEVGDGTTTVAVFASELLKQAEKLIACKIHPQTIISGFRKSVKVAEKALTNCAKDNSADSEKFKEDLMNIARTTLSSKILTQHKDKFSKLAVDAVLRLKGSCDLHAIQIIKKLGGSLEDSFLDEGFLLDKKIGVNQPKRIENAKILIGNTSMDADKIKVFGSKVRVESVAKVAELELAEKEKMKDKVDMILKHGINCFINRQLIYNYPEQLFADNGVMAIEHADFEGVERLALVTGGEIVSTFGKPELVKLGKCKLIEEIMIGEDKLIHFSGVDMGEACSIVIRAATQQILDEAERSLHDALCVLSQTVKDTKVVYGGGCTEMLMANAVIELAAQTPGKESMAIEGFAQALRQLPTIIADNAGFDSTELVSQLRAAHTDGKSTFGLDMENGCIADIANMGIRESFKVKRQALISAAEAAEMILRVDDIIKAAPRQRGNDAC